MEGPPLQIQPFARQEHNTDKLLPLTHGLVYMTTWVIKLLNNLEQAFGERDRDERRPHLLKVLRLYERWHWL